MILTRHKWPSESENMMKPTQQEQITFPYLELYKEQSHLKICNTQQNIWLQRSSYLPEAQMVNVNSRYEVRDEDSAAWFLHGQRRKQTTAPVIILLKWLPGLTKFATVNNTATQTYCLESWQGMRLPQQLCILYFNRKIAPEHIWREIGQGRKEVHD